MTGAVWFVRFLGVAVLAAILIFTPWPWKILPYAPFVGGLVAYGFSLVLPDRPDLRAAEAERAWCRAIMEPALPSTEPSTCDRLVA